MIANDKCRLNTDAISYQTLNHKPLHHGVVTPVVNNGFNLINLVPISTFSKIKQIRVIPLGQDAKPIMVSCPAKLDLIS